MTPTYKYKMITIPYLVEVKKEFEYYFYDQYGPRGRKLKIGDKYWSCKVQDESEEHLLILFNSQSIAFFRGSNIKDVLVENMIFAMGEGHIKMTIANRLSVIFKFGEMELIP